MAIAMAMTIVLGRNYRNALDRVSLLQWRTEALMTQLRAEKADADDVQIADASWQTCYAVGIEGFGSAEWAQIYRHADGSWHVKGAANPYWENRLFYMCAK